jgi:hypothetical protein
MATVISSDNRTEAQNLSFELPQRFAVAIRSQLDVEISECAIYIEEYILIYPHFTEILRIASSNDIQRCMIERAIHGTSKSKTCVDGEVQMRQNALMHF